MITNINEDVFINVQLEFEETDKYPQASLYDASGTIVTTINLPHVENGLYGATYNPSQDGSYTLIYRIYSEDTYTTRDTLYDNVTPESLFVMEDHPDLFNMDDTITLIRKLISNNQKIEISQNQLIIYDDDGVNPIKTYNLFNRDGDLDFLDIFERKIV